jgi:aminoglycoside phosphotransferase (APT) family kinase protein
VWETAMEELCRIARVPVSHVPFLDDPHLGASGVEQQLEYWRASVDWATGDRTPDGVWEIYAWLEANLPADRTNGFAWGDARIGNMMFGADFRLAGVMDWEAANLSGPRQDLAWWVLFDEFNASTASGAARRRSRSGRTASANRPATSTGTRCSPRSSSACSCTARRSCSAAP